MMILSGAGEGDGVRGHPAPQAPDRKERAWLGGTENRREGKDEAR